MDLFLLCPWNNFVLRHLRRLRQGSKIKWFLTIVCSFLNYYIYSCFFFWFDQLLPRSFFDKAPIFCLVSTPMTWQGSILKRVSTTVAIFVVFLDHESDLSFLFWFFLWIISLEDTSSTRTLLILFFVKH